MNGKMSNRTNESKNDEGRDFIVANISPMTIFGENKTMMVNGNAMITVITNDVAAPKYEHRRCLIDLQIHVAIYTFRIHLECYGYFLAYGKN